MTSYLTLSREESNANAVKIGNSSRCCKLKRKPFGIYATVRVERWEGSKKVSESEDLPVSRFVAFG
jgi:hypothetical protein